MNDLEHNPNRFELSTDAGGYYCEHAFFMASLMARSMGSLARDADGNGAVGFLHVPDDRDSKEGDQDPVTMELPTSPFAHSDRYTAATVARVVRAWAALPCPDPTAPILLTGFGPFSDVHDNPSQRAVQNEAVATSLQGVGPILTRVLDVDDSGTMDLCRTIEATSPRAILMLGVRRGTPGTYAVESVATDRNLQWALQASHYPTVHRSGLAARLTLRANPALARALEAGPHSH